MKKERKARMKKEKENNKSDRLFRNKMHSGDILAYLSADRPSNGIQKLMLMLFCLNPARKSTRV